MGEAHYKALEARGLDADQAVKRGWHACTGPTDDLWIGIPYFDMGKRVGCKRRTITGPKRFYQDAGSQQIFWNVDCLRDETLKDQPLIITEGEMDAEAAIQAGFPRTVSVPGGALQSADDGAEDGAYWNFLRHAEGCSLLTSSREIVLAADGDGPGANLLQALGVRLGRYRCKYLSYPTGSKDLNDVLIAMGHREVARIVQAAMWLKMSGLYRMSELPPLARPEPLNIGIAGMDEHLRLRRTDLWVVTGPAGHGKSSFINNVCCNVAQSYGIKTCFASFEQHPSLDHRRALRSHYSRKLEIAMSGAERAEADEWIDKMFDFVVPEEDIDTTLAWVLELFARSVVRRGVGVCVLDPWNEIDHSDKPRGWTQAEFVSQGLRQIKRFSRKYNVAMIVAAHPAKMQRDREGKMPKPGLYDIADSAAFANRCDAGVVVYRPDMLMNNETEIAVVKSRYFSQIGRPGAVTGVWDDSQTRYTIVNDGAGMEYR